ncbi:MAG TPA: 2-polyprenyl-3-methyl-6-methoxy-1,4-benzoquinone monooxygenase [Burkholderiales bacterium]|nr:2-polyprenyl-3-methyl-6-methoxy-1,4-benzoquinone monooxygenase [Burkholderiales bacterium]
MNAMTLDDLIVQFDKALRTLTQPAKSVRAIPGEGLQEASLTVSAARLSAALMRVNHSGEICAQALYDGQALTARDGSVQQALQKAATEETEHLAWTEQRIEELGGRKSLLNLLWYGGSFAIGALAGLLGDKWNLGFLAETERQVERHLEEHLQRLPSEDLKSHAILEQMKNDEAQHATTAIAQGAAELPPPMKLAMQLASKVMTRTAFWI